MPDHMNRFITVLFAVWIPSLFPYADASLPETDAVLQKQVTQLVAFGKTYGYIRYFYPGNLEKTDWEKICQKGVSTINDPANLSDLAGKLNTYFHQLAPFVTFDATARNTAADLTTEHRDQLLFREYLGLNTGDKYSDFKNYLRTVTVNAGQRYPLKLLSAQIAPAVFINMPLVQWSSQVPAAKNEYSVQLPAEDSLTNMRNRWITKAIITWNIIQHFYPYRDDIRDWEQVLPQSISSLLTAGNNSVCRETYEQMIAKLSDGHARYMDSEDQAASYCLPVELVMIDTALYIKDIIAGDPRLKTGDELVSINGVPVSCLKKTADATSSGGDAFKKQLFCLSVISGNKNDTAHISYRRNNSTQVVDLVHSLTPSSYNQLQAKRRPDSVFFDNRQIAYFDLRKWPYKGLKKMIPDINKLKGVVFDLRGYPTGDMDYLLQHLLVTKDTTSHWLQIPLIKAPDFTEVVFKNEGWELVPSTPHITTKVFFLADSRTYSFAESILGFVKDYKLGTIIGEASAGTNGDMNSFTFSDKSMFTWSAVKVTTPTGQPYKKTGIVPDIPVPNTAQSVVAGKDLPLEKALAEIRK